MLVLFSGTGSIDKCAKEQDWDVISVDLDPSCGATHTEDVLDIPLDRWPEGYFDFIWASPVCTHFSRLQNTAKNRNPEDLLLSRRLILHTLLLIRSLKPTWWVLENPDSGTLKHESMMQNLNEKSAVVNYCKYSIPGGDEEYLYRKATRLWLNFDFTPLVCKHDCLASVNGKRHLTTAQRGTSRYCPTDRCYTQKTLYRVPRLLCLAILDATHH